MLVSRPSKKEIRARGGKDDPILLVPELCTRTGELVLLMYAQNQLILISAVSILLLLVAVLQNQSELLLLLQV